METRSTGWWKLWIVAVHIFTYCQYQLDAWQKCISLCATRYILYKLPNRNAGGLSYLYMDGSSNGWRRSTENINSNSGTLAHTLRPLLDSYTHEVTRVPLAWQPAVTSPNSVIVSCRWKDLDICSITISLRNQYRLLLHHLDTAKVGAAIFHCIAFKAQKDPDITKLCFCSLCFTTWRSRDAGRPNWSLALTQHAKVSNISQWRLLASEWNR